MDTGGIVLFNRDTERKEGGGFIVLDTSYIKKCHIRINRFGSRMMKLDEFDFLEFLKIGDRWYMHPTTLKRGYKLHPQGGTGELRIYSKIFILELLHDLKYSAQVVRFKIKKEKTITFKGDEIFLIDTSMSYKSYSWTEMNT